MDNERDILGKKLINPHNQIEGEVFIGPGEQDGYSKMNPRKDYNKRN